MCFRLFLVQSHTDQSLVALSITQHRNQTVSSVGYSAVACKEKHLIPCPHRSPSSPSPARAVEPQKRLSTQQYAMLTLLETRTCRSLRHSTQNKHTLILLYSYTLMLVIDDYIMAARSLGFHKKNGPHSHTFPCPGQPFSYSGTGKYTLRDGSRAMTGRSAYNILKTPWLYPSPNSSRFYIKSPRCNQTHNPTRPRCI